jgi:hypothetical protein
MQIVVAVHIYYVCIERSLASSYPYPTPPQTPALRRPKPPALPHPQTLPLAYLRAGWGREGGREGGREEGGGARAPTLAPGPGRAAGSHCKTNKHRLTTII